MSDRADCNPDLLMQLVRSNDPRALDNITRCYSERLFAAGRRHCRTVDEAADAVQDALEIAATNLSSFRGEGSVEGWLVRIVASACRRLSRGQKNDPTRHETEITLSAAGESPEVEAAQHEALKLLDRVLLQLDPEDRAVLLLSEAEEWTAAEISEKLGMTSGAVRTRLTRLRARVRAALKPLLDEPDH